jgi:Fe-S-cluster-containing dehydrogenase component
MKIQIDSNLCRDCQACTLACSLYHHGECNLDLARLRVNKDMARYTFEIILCRQCDSPDCIAACPNESIRIDEYGRVILFEDECLQCGACAEACPYHAIFYNENLGRYLKCDLCRDRVGGPLCVELCPVGALTLSVEKLAEV